MKSHTLKTLSTGFTLIELLVVISIIGVLAALAAGAVIRVRGGQDKRNTEVAVAKLGSALDMQFKASMDMVREQPIPPGLLTAAGNDPARARAVMGKVRIRADFPQTTAEATGGIVYADYGVSASQTYIKKLAAFGGGGTPHEQSAICLHMILTQARRGVMFNLDDAVGASGIGQVLGMPVFMDRFGSPIGFRRWADPANAAEGTVLNELNTSSDATPNAARKDPFDAEGRFLVGWVDSQVPPLTTVLGGPFLTNNNFSPFVYSLGRNKNFDGAEGDDIYSFRLRKSGQRGGN